MKKYKYLVYFSINSFHTNIEHNSFVDSVYLIDTKTGIEKLKKSLMKDYCSDSIVIKNIMRLK